MAQFKFKLSSHLPFIAGIVLSFSVGLTVIALQQQQETRSRAILYKDTGGTAGGGTSTTTTAEASRCYNAGGKCQNSSCNLSITYKYGTCGSAGTYCCVAIPKINTTCYYKGVKGTCKTGCTSTEEADDNSVYCNTSTRGPYLPLACCVPKAPAIKPPTVQQNGGDGGGGGSTPKNPPENPPAEPPAAPITKLSVDLLLDGIGKAGDRVRPGVAGGGNMDPEHKDPEAKINIYNSQGGIVLNKTGKVEFNSDSGSFKGDIDLGNSLPNGTYIIKVKLRQSLETKIGTTQTITAGTTKALPQTSLITGDINDDNLPKPDARDYNILLGCYSTYDDPVSCGAGQDVQADLDDDRDVDQFDFNLFIRELWFVTGSS